MTDATVDREAIRLFEAVLALPEDAREAWLDEHTAERPELRARVEAMRAADQAASLRTGGAIGDVEDDAPPPERLGGYRLLERIGRGGMGSVYRAARDIGDFDHVAAIKIVKPGLLSEALVDRFRRERQTLARLSHPGIARLFGGGETDEGAPYIIMELVDGVSLPVWIETTSPDLATRLTLFREACAAVAFAHANLVAHRDITPSNILVTADGHAKLIDFGIARGLDERTAEGAGGSGSLKSLALTPGFAAPERQSGEAISTAADIYSLGRVLNRIVGADGQDGELRAIIARATAPEPADRYPTADALAADVAAYQAGEPVAAYPAGRGYALGKFVRRHRLAVGSAAAGLLLILAALALSLALYVRAEDARRTEAARFQQLRSLARFMVFDLNPRLERVAGTVDARLALADRAQSYLTALAATPRSDPTLRLEAAQGLIALAKAQGVPSQPHLARQDDARRNLTRAIGMLRASELPPSEKAPALADGLAALAMMQLHVDTKPEGARGTLKEASAMLDTVPAAERGWPWYDARSGLRAAQLDVALLDQKPDEIGQLADRLEREIDEWPAERRHGARAAFDRATADYNRGLRGYLTDDLQAGVAAFERAERRLAAIDAVRPNDPRVLYLLAWVRYTGYGTADGIDQPRASRFLADAEATIGRLLAIEPRDSALLAFSGNIGGARAQSLSTQGQHELAVATQQQVVRRYAASLAAKPAPATRNRLALAQFVLGNITLRAGRQAESCAAYSAAQATAATLKSRGELLGFVEEGMPGLTDKVERCRADANLR
ncbi:protein kinase domain-containing protein [Sphingomonas sp. ID0503]|uniref:protein kinase domain-containing protein n=1 Tax=Sphingomonas sp. ID0503 TaxID=3399691 RepID=UPI003AFAF40B